jgi:hypothetical protein
LAAGVVTGSGRVVAVGSWTSSVELLSRLKLKFVPVAPPYETAPTATCTASGTGSAPCSSAAEKKEV